MKRKQYTARLTTNQSNADDVAHHDLDWFIGYGGIDEESFAKSREWLENLPSNLENN